MDLAQLWFILAASTVLTGMFVLGVTVGARILLNKYDPSAAKPRTIMPANRVTESPRPAHPHSNETKAPTTPKSSDTLTLGAALVPLEPDTRSRTDQEEDAALAAITGLPQLTRDAPGRLIDDISTRGEAEI